MLVEYRFLAVDSQVFHRGGLHLTGLDRGIACRLVWVVGLGRRSSRIRVNVHPFACGCRVFGSGRLKTLHSLHIWDAHSHLIGIRGLTSAERMAGMIRFADRVMYGSDVSFASQLGKVMEADLTDSSRRLVLGGNLRRVRQPILNAKGVKV